MHAQVRGILFDSGDTLVHPREGRWWPRWYFREALDRHAVRSVAWDRLDAALDAGMDYLDRYHRLETEQEERAQFARYYEIVLSHLGVGSPPTSLIEDLAHASVHELEFELYEDTERVTRELQEAGLRLGIVSDAWPSLDRKFRVLGLRDRFSPFVISSRVGCCKPDERIFRAALDGIEIPAKNLVFVDDWPGHVRASIALGLRGVVMAREPQEKEAGLEYVADLDELRAILS